MFSSESSSRSLTLESVKSHFAEWRATHGKGNRIPLSLWNAVKELSKSYSYQQISSEIKISPSRLRKKCEPARQGLSPASSPFVQVPLSSFPSSSLQPPSEQKAQPCLGSLELTRIDGTTLKASGLDNKTLYALIQRFLNQ